MSMNMIRVVKSTLTNTTAVLRIDDLQRSVNIVEGTVQGTALGPTLCNFFFLPLLLQWKDKWSNIATVLQGKETHALTTSSMLHSFADDTTDTMSSKQHATQFACELCYMLDDFGQSMHASSSLNEKSKSVVLYIPAKKKENDKQTCDQKLCIDEAKTIWISFEDNAVY